MLRFPEEHQALAGLLEEWYAEINNFTEQCDGIVSNKAKQYDRLSPIWHRINWPEGFVSEMRKKTDRVSQLLANFTPTNPTELVDWDEVNEELSDIVNYARMMAAINNMVKGRK